MAHLLGRVVARLVSSLSAARSQPEIPTTTTTTITAAVEASATPCPTATNKVEAIVDADSIADTFEVVSNELEAVATFTKDEVLHLAKHARMAYRHPTVLVRDRKQLLESAEEQIFPFQTYACQGFVATRGKQVTIAFKGTSTLYDAFITDLYALPAFPTTTILPQGGFVHGGFLAAFESAWPQLLQILDEHIRREGLASLVELDKITVTGHSLGGALATVAVLYLAHHARQTAVSTAAFDDFMQNKMRMCTFGSPRVLSVQAAHYFNDVLGMGARSLRVAQNGIDVVTMVVPGSLGYRHVGINLTVELDAWTRLPHVMKGYCAGVDVLQAATFVPQHYVGVRRQLIHACISLFRLAF